VNYRHNGRQCTLTFYAQPDAEKFATAIKTIGVERALTAFGVAPTKAAIKAATGPLVGEWIATHIYGLSGVTKSTRFDYESYLRRDIGPALGHIPLNMLTQADVSAWVESMRQAGSAGKTIANKHGLLSAALNAAVTAGHITDNPAAGTRLPRSEKAEMVFLTPDEYPLLRAGFTAHWWPLLDFLVSSGARFGEVAALRPGDVDRVRGTVYIGRSMKRTYDADSYEIGATKTARSVRTISVAAEVLDALDYSHPTLFVNTKGTPLRIASFRANVWYPSRDRATAAGLTKQPRIHDMRHTCASWMIDAGIPLPVIQRHLGHESIATTVNLYGHMDRRQADEAAAAIGAALRPASA
jgi:integrase